MEATSGTQGQEEGEKEMKNWVVDFLKPKGDDKISEEELLRELQVPTFCYRRLSDFFIHDFDDRIKSLFGSFLADLEPDVFAKLQTTPNLYLHNVTKIGEVHRITPQYQGKPIDLVEFSRLDEMGDSCAIGALAHEFAHVYLCHSDRVTVGLNLGLENEADSLVVQWGFGFELNKVREYLKTKKKGEFYG